MRQIDPKTYEPIDYRVLIRDLPVEEKTRGGIIVPEITKKADEFAQQFGVVIRCSALAFSMETKDGRFLDPSRPDVGDLVNYAKYAGGTFQIDDSENRYRILRDEDVLGVVERGYEAAQMNEEAA